MNDTIVFKLGKVNEREIS